MAGGEQAQRNLSALGVSRALIALCPRCLGRDRKGQMRSARRRLCFFRFVFRHDSEPQCYLWPLVDDVWACYYSAAACRLV